MNRTVPNLLEEIDYYSNEPADDQARYGADLLGRAIGHEAGLTAFGGPAPIADYAQIIYGSGFDGSHRIMIFKGAGDAQTAMAREVSHGR